MIKTERRKYYLSQKLKGKSVYSSPSQACTFTQNKHNIMYNHEENFKYIYQHNLYDKLRPVIWAELQSFPSKTKYTIQSMNHTWSKGKNLCPIKENHIIHTHNHPNKWKTEPKHLQACKEKKTIMDFSIRTCQTWRKLWFVSFVSSFRCYEVIQTSSRTINDWSIDLITRAIPHLGFLWMIQHRH
jgi:hypothetical protein